MISQATGPESPAPVQPQPPWDELLAATGQECLSGLKEAAERDWTVPAGGLEWSCRAALDHLALGLIGYAGLLIARPTDRYITLFASLDAQAPVAHCLEGLHIATVVLRSAVREAPATVRAWHPWGHSDASGFAAMGLAELTVHTFDIGRGLGLELRPSNEVSAVILDRLFPDAPVGHAASDTLLWCTGRTELPGLPHRTSWQWDGTVR
ncbi:maleylpyruvate isomerase N-terminal domain-containing protein [Streptomyces smyrnaeus]|uniref:maleylpyruvate isomerase N-terminal domain-containing protein n=1 Tax=Streptomyces smyrnaeus TaxID=1387713 RepID=UPI0027DC109A|nr:maleylpyruvate isomerase N-terminal domain-containing protein [Streptomyces smyrnaeus]